jgi:hypothetical protein
VKSYRSNQAQKRGFLFGSRSDTSSWLIFAATMKSFSVSPPECDPDLVSMISHGLLNPEQSYPSRSNSYEHMGPDLVSMIRSSMISHGLLNPEQSHPSRSKTWDHMGPDLVSMTSQDTRAIHLGQTTCTWPQPRQHDLSRPLKP